MTLLKTAGAARRANPLKIALAAALTVGLMSAPAIVSAQQQLSVEELEKKVEEQRIALEEAIANREATAAQAEEIQAALDESEESRLAVEAKIETLCKEQEELNAGSFDECMKNAKN